MSAKSDRSLEILVAAAPSLFVVLWSTGFIVTKYGLPYAEPFTFCAVRLVFVTLAAIIVALVFRAPWPGWSAAGHNIVSGILVHGLYLTGVCVAIAQGMPLGITALVVGLQPILTSTLANRLLGERVYLLQWIGLALGFAGLWLVVQAKAQGDTSLSGWIAIVGSLFGITLGTLYQKRFGGDVNLLSALPVQYAAASVYAGIGAFLFEQRIVEWSTTLVLSMIWLVVVLSGGAVVLLFMLIRRSAATRVASLFYLTPPTTALMSYVLFGETLGALAIAGMLFCVAGVFLVNWKTQPAA